MARRTTSERRAEVLATLKEAERAVADMEAKDATRIGKLAVKAGLADLDLDDPALLKEFQVLAGRFRDGKGKPAGAHTRAPAADGADASPSPDGRA